MLKLWFVGVLVCVLAYVESKPFFFHMSYTPPGSSYSTPCNPYPNNYPPPCHSYSGPCNPYPNYPQQYPPQYPPNRPSPCNPGYPPIDQQPDGQQPTRFGIGPEPPDGGNIRPGRSHIKNGGRRRPRPRRPPPYGSRFLARPNGYNSGRHDDPFPSDYPNAYAQDQGDGGDEYMDESYDDDYGGYQDDY